MSSKWKAALDNAASEEWTDVARTVREQALREIQLEQLDENGLAVARRITDLADAIVTSAYEQSTHSSDPKLHALVALGGFGRREMAPHSDIDLLFLFQKEGDKSPEFISGVLHPLWDLGFDVGHSSRTIAEVVKMAREDVESCTAMMDGRLLAGDSELFAKYVQRLFSRLPKSVPTQINKWRQARIDNKDSVQLLEPNIKESPGGLRDIQALEWAMKSQKQQADATSLWSHYLESGDVEAIERARAFLWRVRHQMHFAVGRKCDVLEQDLKMQIAESFGYRDGGHELGVERFMHDYYHHARAVFHLVDLAFERLTRKPRQSARSKYIEHGVLSVDGEILLSDGEDYFAEDPVRMLRIFLMAQVKNLRLSEEVKRTVKNSLNLIGDALRADPEACAVFMRILKRRTRVAKTLRSMHQLGVLGAYLPEFGGLDCLVQYDIYHIYTVDEHTLVALENLESLGGDQAPAMLAQAFAEFERKDLLYLSVLLHDVGKWKRQEHISCGVEMTKELVERLALPEDERRLLVFLVRRHQDMVMISRRRDLDDIEMIRDFASDFANMQWLSALYLLSYADLSAVSPDAWSEWQGALLWELYYKTAEQLKSGMQALEERQRARQILDGHIASATGRWPTNKIAALQAHVEQLPPRYLVAYDIEQVEAHLDLIKELGDADAFTAAFVERVDFTEIVVCTRDRPQILAKICGALAVNDLNILRADVNTREDRIALDIFQVQDVDGTSVLADWKKERVIERLGDVLERGQKARELIHQHSEHWSQRKRGRYVQQPQVEFENGVSGQYTVIDVRAQDDVGLLYRITYALGEAKLDIHMALVDTVASRAADAFYVLSSEGTKIEDYEVLEDVRQRLLNALEKP